MNVNVRVISNMTRLCLQAVADERDNVSRNCTLTMSSDTVHTLLVNHPTDDLCYIAHWAFGLIISQRNIAKQCANTFHQKS